MSKRISIAAILKGMAFSLIVLLCIALVVSAIAYLFHITGGALVAVSNIALAVAVFTGGLVAARKAGKKGLLHGIAIAGVYLVLVVILTGFWGTFSWAILLKKAIIAATAGCLGGIFGIR